MFDLATLREVAYASERVRARRLLRGGTITEHDALIGILQTATPDRPLAQLIVERQQQQHQDARRRAARAQKKADFKEIVERASAPDGVHWYGWFDGSAEPNPGRIGLGGVLRDPFGAQLQFSLRGDYGDSNQAEYSALIGLLESACQRRATPLIVYGDSKIVLDDVLDIALVAALSAYRKRARALLLQLPAVLCTWIPRHKNQLADRLARNARTVPK